MSNKKEWMLERLDRLVKICKSTEPDSPDDSWLFTPHVIDAHEMYLKVNTLYDSLNHEEKVEIMKKANTVWKIRRKIWNGEWDDVSASTLHGEVEDMIEAGQVINAIKHYRHEMNEKFDEEVSLRTAKEFVDQLASTMKSRGMVA